MGTRRKLRRPVMAALASASLIAASAAIALVSPTSPAQAAGPGPCDIYASGGTPCVAAHSTTRALFGAYNGRLYQVRRASDNTTRDIATVGAGPRQSRGLRMFRVVCDMRVLVAVRA